MLYDDNTNVLSHISLYFTFTGGVFVDVQGAVGLH